jgi:hypothetical protein
MNNGPRKGGGPKSVGAIRAVPGLEGFFALHRNTATAAADNVAPEFTANDDDPCRGALVRLTVAPDSRSYTVTIPSKGTVRSFRTPGP